MNQDVRTTAARLRKALSDKGIAAKLTHAYDLVAAARGLRNRELLKRPYAMPTEADLTMLAEVAARVSSTDADVVVRYAAAIAMPRILTCEIDWDQGYRRTADSFELTFEEIEDVDAFLDGPRAKAGIETVSKDIYYTAYYLDRSNRGLSLKQANKLADEIFEQGDDVDVLEKYYGEPQSEYDAISENHDRFEKVVEALETLADEVGAEFDADGWREALEDAVREKLVEDDDSSVEDMITSQDVAEIVFLLAPPTAYVADAQITTNGGSCDPECINLDANLQFALSRIGYTIGEYRRFTGSEMEADADLDPDLKPSSRVLATPGRLCSIIANASSDNFHLCLYVQVPISDVLAVDRSKPVTLRKAKLAAYDIINGAFYDEGEIAEITLNPKDGALRAIGRWYSPSDVCCMSNDCYQGRMENPPEPAEADGGSEERSQHELALAA